MIVYITTNLINGKKYIGKDVRNNNSYLGSGKMFKKAINKYGKENFIKEILCYAKNKKDLNELEIYYIDYYNAIKSDLFYNIGKGGTGGKILEDYSYQNTKVYQFDIKGNFIREWNSIKEACDFLKGCSQNIVRACKTGGQSLGYRWSYSLIPIKAKTYLKSKPILQYSLEGEFIKEWTHLTLIRDELGLDVGQISGVLRNVRKTAKGYRWIYKDNDNNFVNSVQSAICSIYDKENGRCMDIEERL